MSREVANRPTEVLEPTESWAHPVDFSAVDGTGQPVVIYMQAPAVPLEPEVPEPSKTIPWLLIALALVILLFACFAAWHTWVGPQLVPVRSHPVDLVGPSR